MRTFYWPGQYKKYLPSGQIEQVLCDGESYDGARPCHYEWVKALHDECRAYNITFVFCTLGSYFVKDGKTYHIQNGKLRSEQAARSGLSFQGKPISFKLTDTWGYPIPEEELYQPYFGAQCSHCSMKLICNGCSHCGKCG